MESLFQKNRKRQRLFMTCGTTFVDLPKTNSFGLIQQEKELKRSFVQSVVRDLPFSILPAGKPEL